MSVSDIVQLGDPRLREVAQSVDDFSCPKFQHLVCTLYQTLHAADGIGIAAPQIGEPWQVLIMASRPNRRYPHAPDMAPLLMVNPRFSITDNRTAKDWEGCLSVPGIRALVPRYLGISVSYQDSNGQPCQLDLNDFPARVFQHEYDHLIGKVYLDSVDDNRDIVAESEFFKRIAA
jgi:peptide deformylase